MAIAKFGRTIAAPSPDPMPRLNAKHIKHSPNTTPYLQVVCDTTFLVKSKTPYVSALKRITKKLDKYTRATQLRDRHSLGAYKKVQYITVKGMGRAIEKTLLLALEFQDRLMYRTDIQTGSVEVIDEFKMEDGADSDWDEDDRELVYKKRMVSYVEVRIWIKG